MSSIFSSKKLVAIGDARSTIENAIRTHESTYGEPEKLELAKQELQPVVRANIGLFKQVAPAFIQQTIEAASEAIRPWISDAHTREKIINDHFGIREIQLKISSVEGSIYDPSSAIAGLRSMAHVFNAVLSAPQNQP